MQCAEARWGAWGLNPCRYRPAYGTDISVHFPPIDPVGGTCGRVPDPTGRLSSSGLLRTPGFAPVFTPVRPIQHGHEINRIPGQTRPVRVIAAGDLRQPAVDVDDQNAVRVHQAEIGHGLRETPLKTLDIHNVS